MNCVAFAFKQKDAKVCVLKPDEINKRAVRLAFNLLKNYYSTVTTPSSPMVMVMPSLT